MSTNPVLDKIPMSLLNDILEAVFSLIRGLVNLVGTLSTMAGENLGPYGLPAFYLVALVVVFLAVWGIVHFIFKILRYLVLPAVIIALVGSMFLPHSFMTLLPFSAAGCSLILLIKG